MSSTESEMYMSKTGCSDFIAATLILKLAVMVIPHLFVK